MTSGTSAIMVHEKIINYHYILLVWKVWRKLGWEGISLVYQRVEEPVLNILERKSCIS